MILSDIELLRRFADNAPDAQAAFATLVERHLNLVYSMALRQVRSSQLAEDVAQTVFLDLARHARRVDPATPLVAWLHLVSRRSAIDVVRRESRRQARERAAADLATMHPDPPSPDWSAIEPLLDETVASLPARDRTAILLRYFENKSLRDIGGVIGTTDDTAQKRLTRALEQLRIFFARRGITVSAAALASDLAGKAMLPAPSGLAQVIAAASAALPATMITTTVATLAMTMLQKLGLASALVATIAVVYEANHLGRQRRLLDETHQKVNAVVSEAAALRVARKNADSRLSDLRAQLETRRAQATQTPSAADTTLAAQIDEWLAQVSRLKNFVSNQPSLNIPELQFLSEEDWFTVGTGGSFASEQDLRKASSGLRHRAEGTFAAKLNRALSAYVKANDNRLPDSPVQLLPFFDPPVEPVLLERYEMLRRGSAADIPPAERNRVVAPKAPADPERDAYYSVGLNGYGSSPSLNANLQFAEREFRKANPGRDPIAAIELMPFLKWPADSAALQSLLDRQREWRMKGGAR